MILNHQETRHGRDRIFSPDIAADPAVYLKSDIHDIALVAALAVEILGLLPEYWKIRALLQFAKKCFYPSLILAGIIIGIEDEKQTVVERDISPLSRMNGVPDADFGIKQAF